jgi:Holliday junction resolvase
MYKVRRIDENQPKIVEALRRIGLSVAITSTVSNGFPDIIVGHKNTNYMIELKDGSKIPSKQKLTPEEIDFHDKWKGQIATCNSLEQVLEVIGL